MRGRNRATKPGTWDTARLHCRGYISFIVLLRYFPWSLFAILNPMTACVRLFLNPGKKGFCSENQFLFAAFFLPHLDFCISPAPLPGD